MVFSSQKGTKKKQKKTLHYDSQITGRRDYGTSLFSGRKRFRDEFPYTGHVITGRRRLRDEPPYETLNYGTEALTGQASLRDGGAYGTSRLRDSLITGRRRLRDEPPCGTKITGRRDLRDAPPYGPEALTGRVCLRDS